MAITLPQWISDVRDGLLALGKDLAPDTIEGGVNYCLQQLADLVVHDPKTRTRLQKSFSLTLASGVTTLPTTLLTSPKAIESYVLTGAGSYPWEYLPNGNDRFFPPQYQDFTYYVIQNDQLTAFDDTGTVTTETSATLKGNYVPLISEVPDVLSDDFTAVGIKWAMGQIEEEAAA